MLLAWHSSKLYSPGEDTKLLHVLEIYFSFRMCGKAICNCAVRKTNNTAVFSRVPLLEESRSESGYLKVNALKTVFHNYL